VLQDNRDATLFDYLSRAKDAALVVSERDEVEVNASKRLEQLQRSYDDLGGPDSTRTSAPAPSELFADWDTIESRLARATALAQLGLDDEAPREQQGTSNQQPAARREPREALPAHPVRCQPAVEMRGRLADWVAEIRRLRDAGETTLFVAATSGRAERTIELLKEYEVF